MRPWQPDLFAAKTPDPNPLERRPGRPYEPGQKGFRKKKPGELSDATVLALAEWANGQPATLKKPKKDYGEGG